MVAFSGHKSRHSFLELGIENIFSVELRVPSCTFKDYSLQVSRQITLYSAEFEEKVSFN
jgi:hypothetical protein